MKNTKHKSALRLIDEIINWIPMERSGTYNRQDPTYYEKGTLELSNGVTLNYNDVTWGIELTIHSNKIYQSIYYSRGSGYNDPDELCPREDWQSGTLANLKRMMPLIKEEGFDKVADLEYRMSEDYEPDPYGCLADYE